MAKRTTKTTAGKINAETARALELLDASASALGDITARQENASSDLARSLRLLGYKYANNGTEAVESLKARFMTHYGTGWLKGRGLNDNADAVRGVTMTPDAFKALEGKASDPASPKGRAKVYREAYTSAGLMGWRRGCDAADPDGAKVRKEEAAAKREAAGKSAGSGKSPKTPTAKAGKQVIECDAALYAAFVAIAKDADLAKEFMEWAASAIPDAT